jgi:quercetin dioxygenase-like cupin family protein
MKSMQLLEGVEFGDRSAHAEPLYVDRHGRAIRFSLKPGQSIKEHNAPDSPFYAIVLKGKGMFAGGDGKEQLFGPGALLIFDPKENHVIRALDEELVFVGFLGGAPSNVSEKVGGKLGRKRK